MSLHVGMDVHKKFCQVTVMDELGKILEKRRIPTELEELKQYFVELPGPATVAMEAGRSWYWLNDLLESVGVEVKLSHPKKTRIISEATLSTDEIDSEVLAQLERTNFLPTSYIPPKEIRRRRELLRYRTSLVRIRSALKNKVHAVLGKLGIRHGFSDLFGSKGKEFLLGLEADKVFREEIQGYLRVIEKISEEVRKTEVAIKRTVEKESPEAKLLMTVPGIGYFSALLLVSEIGEIKRFASFRKLCAYAGLVPTTDQTAEKIRHGHTMKDSNKYIRWVLLEAVNKATSKDPFLYSFYTKVLRRRGKGKARVAVAHKLLVSIWFMLKHKEGYKRKYKEPQERFSRYCYRVR